MGVRIERRTSQLKVRVSRRILRRADRLAQRVSEQLGLPATRTDVLRQALLRGLALLEAEDEGGDKGRQ
jgi:hypothetical protein